MRLLVFTLGIRGRVAPISAYTLIEANAEAGVHLPVGAWDPYFNLHGGYARAAMNSQPGSTTIGGVATYGFPEATSVIPPSPDGGDFGGSIGTDYYFSALFSLGADATLDALLLGRASRSIVAIDGPSGSGILPISSASGTGVALLGCVHAGLHIGL